MPDPNHIPEHIPERLPDWEAFYRDYRKPGYVPGFEITSKLGGGAFGLVFKARKESIGKDYAIKFLKVEDSEVRQAVLHELEQVQYFAQIDHPNLVQIEDRGEVDGIPFLVMQFAGSETLRDRMPAAGQVPTAAERDALLAVFLQACRGVSALHEHSLVHFDLKPANVFLHGTMARVGDYGLSKLVTHSRGSLTMGRGTPYYMAPEMLQRRGDHRSDIYTLGVMLYELLCGMVPFTGDNEWEVLRKHEREAPELPAHLEVAERAVLGRCLQKDPAARFQSVHDLVAALGASAPGANVGVGAMAGASAVARPMSPPPPPPPPPPLPPGASIPPCVPPPLPPSARRKRRSAVPPRRTSRALLAVAMIVFAVFAVGLVISTRLARESARVDWRRTEPMVVHEVTVESGNGPDADRVDAVLRRAVQRLNAVRPGRRAPELTPLRLDEFGAMAAAERYRGEIERLVDAPTFSSGHAAKLVRHGRPVFLAAVGMLQQFDYADIDECRRAAHTTALLAAITGLTELRIDPPFTQPGPADRHRMIVLADLWRQLAESCAGCEEDFQAMLARRTR